MTATDLFRTGRLDEAVQALGAELRDNPADSQRRTFLFELLSFSGAYERAEKQLDILAGSSHEAGMGALLYRAALRAERTRTEMFETGTLPRREAAPVAGRINGHWFTGIEDADPRLGACLEMYAAGAYLLMPLAHIAAVEIAAPQRLRDLLWIPAVVHPGPAFKGRELGEVLIPVLTPLAARHANVQVRLGRETAWEETPGGEMVPAGQKLLLADDEEFPLLEIRSLEFETAKEETNSHATS